MSTYFRLLMTSFSNLQSYLHSYLWHMYVHMFVNHRVTLPKNKRTETDTFQNDFCFLCFVSPCEIQKNITIQTHFGFEQPIVVSVSFRRGRKYEKYLINIREFLWIEFCSANCTINLVIHWKFIYKYTHWIYNYTCRAL